MQLPKQDERVRESMDENGYCMISDVAAWNKVSAGRIMS
mgnify:CR=1 FL=1